MQRHMRVRMRYPAAAAAGAVATAAVVVPRSNCPPLLPLDHRPFTQSLWLRSESSNTAAVHVKNCFFCLQPLSRRPLAPDPGVTAKKAPSPPPSLSLAASRVMSGRRSALFSRSRESWFTAEREAGGDADPRCSRRRDAGGRRRER